MQWEPLRVWVARTGFLRGGVPWWNYSTAHGFDQANRPMWDLFAGPDPLCKLPLPSHRPPYIEEARYEACKGDRRGQPKGCCLCPSVAETLDTAHGERGFATTGTLRRLDVVAEQAGLPPAALWRSVDEVVTRYLLQQQRDWLAEARP